MADVDRCVYCGVEIPEGRQVCPGCESPMTTFGVTRERLTKYVAMLERKPLEVSNRKERRKAQAEKRRRQKAEKRKP